MKRRVKKNLTILLLSFLSGILLIIAGTTGSVGVYGAVLSALIQSSQETIVRSVLEWIALTLVLLASLGGFSVILGGYLIYKSQMRLGKLIIGLGIGVGIPGLLLAVSAGIATQDFSVVIAQHGIIGWTGIALAILAMSSVK